MIEQALRDRITDLENENRRLRSALSESSQWQTVEAVCCGEKMKCNRCGKSMPCLCGNGVFE